MNKNIEVYECGSNCTTKIGKIEGIITGVNIRFERVIYEFSYFNNGEHKSVWLEECELDCSECSTNKIGFKN